METAKKYSNGLSDYSLGFRTYVVLEYFSGMIERSELFVKYGITHNLFSNWCVRFRKLHPLENLNLSLMSAEEKADNASLEERIKELEKKLDYERLRSLGYKTMIEVAERELGIEIEKKSGTKQ